MPLLYVFGTAIIRAQLQAPDPTLLLMDRNGYFLAQVGEENNQGFGYWPIEKLPHRVVAATLAIEDKRFWSHPGIDPIAIARAFYLNLKNQRHVSGASTIAMQVARMQSPGKRTYARKVVEALTALFSTVRYGREEVLRHYLRIVPYGNQCHGISHAARQYLDKPVADLSWSEIAFLSAIPQSPSHMNPYMSKGRIRAVKRGKRILRFLKQKEVINKQEYSLAIRQIENLQIPYHRERPLSCLHAILNLEQQFSKNPQWRASHKEPVVYTTLDTKLQDRIDDISTRMLNRWRNHGAENVAVVVVKRKSREVLAWFGSIDYFSKNAGAMDFTRIPRSPGSALKPFIYAMGLDRGTISPVTIMDDLQSVSHGIQNMDNLFLGPLLPRQALANSRNVPAVNLLKAIGMDEVFFQFKELNLHKGQKAANYFGPCMAIGCLPVTLKDMVTAYCGLANDGILKDLIWFAGQPENEGKKVFSAESARLVTLFLSDPMARIPSFPRMGTTEFSFPVAIKTGTSQGFRDAWAMAFSRDYVVGIWVGRHDALPMNQLGGAGSAAHLAQAILNDLHPKETRSLADLSFPPPADYVPTEICAYTGHKATQPCGSVLTEWLANDSLKHSSDNYTAMRIDRRNKLRATPWTPAEHVSTQTFINLPNRYHQWIKDKHIPQPPTRYSSLDVPEEHLGKGLSFPPADMPYQPEGFRKIQMAIASPAEGQIIISNPEIPEDLDSIPLRVELSENVPQVLWYVDGKPFLLAELPYTVRWPVQRGGHEFQVKIPYREEKSSVVKIHVE